MQERLFDFKFLKFSPEAIQKFLVWFYIIGAAGFIVPFTRQWFIYLIPYTILFAFVLLMLFHEGKQARFFFLMGFIFSASFMVEVAGVMTKAIFGDYEYGPGLGIKFLNVPLIIGINWLMLIYCAWIISLTWVKRSWLAVPVTGIIMVVFDLSLEPVAIKTGMWHWLSEGIPFQNYLVWFLLSCFFAALFAVSKTRFSNPVAVVLFVCQFAFFVILSLVL